MGLSKSYIWKCCINRTFANRYNVVLEKRKSNALSNIDEFVFNISSHCHGCTLPNLNPKSIMSFVNNQCHNSEYYFFQSYMIFHYLW